MVKRLTLALIFCPLLAGAADSLPSPEELRRMAQEVERKHQQKSQRATATASGDTLADTDPARGPAPAVPQTNKYGAPAKATPTKAPPASKTSHAPRPGGSDALVLPPTHSTGSGTSEIEVLKAKGPRYGIRLGTIIQAEIRRNVSSAESGDIEMWVTKDVIGDRATLPAGTQLFASIRVNAATKRIEGVTGRAVTPNGDELDIITRIYDTNMVAGIAGVVNEANDAITQKGVNRGLIAATRAGLGAVANRTPAGAAITEGGTSALNEVDKRLEHEVNTNIVVYAYPQPILLRVERSF